MPQFRQSLAVLLVVTLFLCAHADPTLVTTWDDLGTLTPALEDSYSTAMCGCTMAVSDSWLVTGCVEQKGYTGAVAVYSKSDSDVTGWAQHTILTPPPDTPSTDGNLTFGISVAVRGDSIAVGCNKEEVNDVPNQGSVFVYSLTDDVWELVGHIMMPEPTDLYFGQQVALSDNYVVVSSRSGLYVSAKSEEGAWGEAVAVPAPNGVHWGAGVLAYEGEILCVGTAYNGDVGSGGSKVVVYDTSVPDWHSAVDGYLQILASPIPFNGSGNYANDVSLETPAGQYPSVLAVGEYQSDVLDIPRAGLVHVYRWTEGLFVIEDTVSHGPITSEGMDFGWKVSIQGSTLAVAGHPLSDYADSGYVSLYSLDTRIPQYIPVLGDCQGHVDSMSLSSDGETVFVGSTSLSKIGGVTVQSTLSLQASIDFLTGDLSRCSASPAGSVSYFTLLDADLELYTVDMSDSIQVFWDCDADLGTPALQPVTFMGGEGEYPYSYQVELTAPSLLGTQRLSIYLDGELMGRDGAVVYTAVSPDYSSIEGGGVGEVASPLSFTVRDTCGDTLSGLDLLVRVTDSDGTTVYMDRGPDESGVPGVYSVTLPPMMEGVYSVVVTDTGSLVQVKADIYVCLATVSDDLHLGSTSAIDAPSSVLLGDSMDVTVTLVDVGVGGPVTTLEPVVLQVEGGATYRMDATGISFTVSVPMTQTGSVTLDVYVGSEGDPFLSTTVEVKVPETPLPIGAIIGWGLFVLAALFILVREVYLHKKKTRYGEMGETTTGVAVMPV